MFPLGNEGCSYVRIGNILCSRSVPTTLGLQQHGPSVLRWILEQPRGSTVGLHPRFRELQRHIKASLLCLFDVVAEAFSASFYMGLFGGKTMKPHKLWSNDANFLNHTVSGATHMPKTVRESLGGAPLVPKYTDKHGVRRYAGIRHRLKASQTLDNVNVAVALTEVLHLTIRCSCGGIIHEGVEGWPYSLFAKYNA